MKYATIALILMPLLTACGGGHFNHDTGELRKVVSADIVQYDQSSREAAIKEIQGGQCETLTEYTKDFKVMRDQTRAVLEKETKQ